MGLGLIAGAALFLAQRPQFYGDYRSVTALAIAPGGHIWAATKGGLVDFSPVRARTFGWDGLIDGESPTDVWIRGGKVFASNGSEVREFGDGKLTPSDGAARVARTLTFVDGKYAVPERPVWPEGLEGPFAPAAENRGTHVSAVAGDPDRLFAGWYGDGLWQYAAGSWKRVDAPSATAFRSIRALAVDGSAVAVAASDLWVGGKGKWRRYPWPEGPGGSVYGFAEYRGRLVACTFEAGLALFDGRHWSLAPIGDHPREAVVFRGVLYVRQTEGRIDRFDGRWKQNVFPWLPRTQATCLASAGGHLLIGQFGGWSEYDGRTWRHYLKLPELKGLVVTALAAKGADVWIGTQERGLMRLSEGKVDAFDQRQGLEDDWVRCILPEGNGVLVGMFKTGAYRLRDGTFARLTPELTGEVTGFARSLGGRLIVASREGLWGVDRSGAARLPGLRYEVQAMLQTPRGLWLGLPNGAAFVPWSGSKE